MATTQVLDPIRIAMKATNDLFNVEVAGKRNFAALDDVYTQDARILPPGAPMISGREAIKKFWSDAVNALHATSVALTSADVMPAGDGVVEIGAATITVEPPGQPAAQVEAKYVVHWREEAGKWKWHVDIWNMNG
jgi:ketosteroid isomerase-like protein